MIGIFCIMMAMFLDLFDGIIARMMGTEGEIGKQLDSLADMVSFGIAPAMIYFRQFEHSGYFTQIGIFVFISACALRLAKYNITDSGKTFQGLPSPAAASFIIGIIMAHITEVSWVAPIFNNEIAYILLPIAIGILMISNLTMFSFKTIKDGFRENIGLFLCIFTFVATLLIQKELTLLMTAIVYILLSFIVNLRAQKK